MAYKAVVASSLMLGAAQGHIFSSWSTQTATTANKIVEIPASGGTRPVAAFGIATGTVSNSSSSGEGGRGGGKERGLSCYVCMGDGGLLPPGWGLSSVSFLSLSSDNKRGRHHSSSPSSPSFLPSF